MHKISIIIPTYNGENHLKIALESIKKQTLGFENIEVVFVDDCSTDNTKQVISDFSKKYPNVKGVFLEENSGLPGKPRNIGKNASGKYLMFLDQDDTFLENACELLYNEINNNDVDMVSGNYYDSYDDGDVLVNWSNYGLTENRIYVKSVKENTNLFNVYPSQWAKIFNKEFILKNEIIFAEGRLAEDLLFVYHALSKANGIIFINKPIIKYNRRLNEQADNSITYSTDNKNYLEGYLKTYEEIFLLLSQIDDSFSYFALNHLHYWTKNFILSKLNEFDKFDLLKSAEFLFQEFKQHNLRPYSDYTQFFNLMFNKDYENVIKLSNALYLPFLSQKNKNLIKDIAKDRTIFLLCYGIDFNIGGLARAVFRRANSLSEKGYKVHILNVDHSSFNIRLFKASEGIKNFTFIVDTFRELGYINDSIKFDNIYMYFSNKNNLKDKILYPIPSTEEYEEIYENVYIKGNLVIHKEKSKDNSILFSYYNKSDFSEMALKFFLLKNFDSKKKIKMEKYINGYLNSKSIYHNNGFQTDYLYTKDGFNYLSIYGKDKDFKFTLNDRKNNTTLEFNSLLEFNDNFITEMCSKCDEKPFLINDCSGVLPSIENIDSNIAYKIGSIHSNPYQGNHCYGNPMSVMAALNNIHDLDALVVLTEAIKKDFTKEFDYENIFVIPNFILNEELLNLCYDTKDNFNKNKLSIFARISPEKNLSDAIKAFKIVVDKYPNAILEIYGRVIHDYEIIEFKKLKKLIADLNLDENIIFKGHVKEVNKEMANSLATLLVSDVEGLPLVLLESMANSTPVISYDLNYGPADVITHNIDGILIEHYDINALANAIIDLLSNPQKAVDLGINARKKISEKFSQNPVILKWENLFREIIINKELNEFNKNCEYNKRKIISITTVKNESDIIESFIRYNLNIVDEMIILDNGSTDDTLHIINQLIEEGLPINIIIDKDRYFEPAKKYNFLLKKAINEFNADIICPIDVDEFIVSNNNSNPRDIIKKIPPHCCYKLKWKTYVPTNNDDEKDLFIPSRIKYIRNENIETFYKVIITKELVNDFDIKLEIGNHNIVINPKYENKITIRSNIDLKIAHFPLRSVDQTMSKVLVSYPNTLSRKNANPHLSHHYPIMFNKIMDIGEIDINDVTNFAKQYSLKPNEDRTDFLQEQEIHLSFCPMNIDFCKNINIRYTFEINHLKNILENYIYFAKEINKFKNEIENLNNENQRTVHNLNNKIKDLENNKNNLNNKIKDLKNSKTLLNNENKKTIKFLTENLNYHKDEALKLRNQNKLLKKDIEKISFRKPTKYNKILTKFKIK